MPYQNASIDFTGRKPKETYTRIVQCSGSTNSIFSTGDGWRIESADITASYAINASGTASFAISASYAQSSSWEVFTEEYATASLSSSWASASWNSNYATTSSWASQSLRANGADIASFAWSAETSSWASSSWNSNNAITASWTSRSWNSDNSISSSWASSSLNTDNAITASWASQSLRANGADIASFAWSAESSSWASSSMTSSTANKVQVIITPGLGDIPVILGHYTGNGPRLLFDDANNIFYRDVYQELHVPTSIATVQSASLKVMTNPGGSMTASFFDGRTTANVVGFVGTSSWSQTSSYAINGGTLLETGSTYQITASWSQTSSYSVNGGTLLETASLYQITASWAQTSSYALSEVTVELFSSTSLSSSWASQSLSASFISGTYGFISQLTATTISSSGGLFGTASWAEFAVAGGTQLYTASTYPITASWAVQAVTSSYISGSIVFAGNTDGYFPQWVDNSLTPTSSLQFSSSVIVATASIIPAANDTYNLGSPSNQWKHAYLTTASLYLGGVPLSMSGSTLIVSSSAVLTAASVSGSLLPVTASNALSASWAPSVVSSSTGYTQYASAESWTNSGNNTPAAFFAGMACVVGDKAYIYGGQAAQNTAPTTNVWSSSAGDPSTIVATSKTLPWGLAFSELIQVSNKLYMVGGVTGAGTYITKSIFSASVSDPTTWGYAGDLPIAVYGGRIVKVGNNLYWFGGVDHSGNYFSGSLTASISNPVDWGVANINWAVPGQTVASGSTRGCYHVVGDKIWCQMGFGPGGAAFAFVHGVYTASVDTPLTWGVATADTTVYLGGTLQKIIVGNNMYVLGGYPGASGVTNTIYKWTLSEAGLKATPTSNGSTPNNGPGPVYGQYDANVISYNNRLYMYGGGDGFNWPATRAQIVVCNYSSLGITSSAATISLAEIESIKPWEAVSNTLTDTSVAYITSSWSNTATTASYAISSSDSNTVDGRHSSYFQAAITTGSLFPITASWAITSSWSQNGLITKSLYPVTASWATTASWAQNGLITNSLYPVTASWATTASWAQNGLITNSLYPVTASRASSAISSSWALNAYTASALYVPSGSGAWRLEVSSSGDLVFVYS